MLDSSEINKNSGIPIGERPEGHFGIMGNNEQPWLPLEAIDFLYSRLDKDFIGFEFGSGSSTFWFSKFTKKIYSVDSSLEWHLSILEKIKENSIDNIFSMVKECEMLPIWDKDLEISEKHIEYSSSILDFEFNFDYILVDGVSRSFCIQNSIDKLNSGGYLIIDNAERPAYQESIQKIPLEWEIFEFSNSVDKTLIYRKNEKSDNNFGI